MANSDRNATTLILVPFLGLLSWLTIYPGVPRVYAPFNLLVVVPYLLTGSSFVASLFVPAFFCVWCWPVLRGGSTLPMRSVVLLGCTVTLSAISMLFGRRFAVQYHGTDYVVGTVAISVTAWIVLSTLAVLARRHPSPRRNLIFHAALFGWLAWYAIPYFGELP